MASEIITNYDFTSFNTDTATQQECIDIVDSLAPWYFALDYLRDTLLTEAMNDDLYSLSPTATQLENLETLKGYIKQSINTNKESLLNTYDDSYVALESYINTTKPSSLSSAFTIEWHFRVIKRDVLKTVISNLTNISSSGWQYYGWKQGGQGWRLNSIANNDTTKGFRMSKGVATSLNGQVSWWANEKDTVISPSNLVTSDVYFVFNQPWETLQTSSPYYNFRSIGVFLVEQYDRYNPSGTDSSTSGKYPSTEMGGLGTFDDSTDLSDISSKPSLNIFNLGFYSLWNPTAAELQSLSAVVWNDPTNWQQWPQIFQSGILKYTDFMPSLGIFPVSSSDLTLQNTNFCMGGIVFNGGLASLGTTLNMNQIKEQIIDVNLGSISLKEYFGSFLDYAPYSSCSLYLPFFGTVELSMNEIQNADKITILYRINLYDGATVIKVHIEKLNNAAQNGSVDLKHVLYEYNTNVKTEIPITSGANSEHMKTIATIVAAAATTVAAPIAGAGAAALAGAAGSGAAGGSALAMVAKNAPEIGQAVSGAVKTGASVANRAINSMPSGGGIQRGNNGSMAFGLLSERTPFLVINRPIQVLSDKYREEYGYTASIYTTIGTITEGYIRCDNVDTTNIKCNEQEREKLIQILTNEGAYI